MEITNFTKTKIDEKALKTAARIAAAVLGIEKLGDVSLVFINDAKMKELNKKYRGKNATTDVLSFEELNEIFICLPFVLRSLGEGGAAKRRLKSNPPSLKLRRASLLKTPLKTELTHLLVHGIVHLKGYEHEKSVKEAERMFRVEEKILEKIL